MPASIDFDLLNSKGYKKSHEVYIPMKSTHERVLKVFSILLPEMLSVTAETQGQSLSLTD